MAFNLFPYSDLHKLNLDWIIKQIKEAKAALDEAAQTVSSYESRLSDLESSSRTMALSIQALQASVTAHGLRLDQAQADIVSLNQRTGAVETGVEQAQATAAEALSTAQEASETAEGLASDVADAVSDASEALSTAQAAGSTAAGAVATANQAAAAVTLLGQEKLDKLGADALEELGVTGNPESTEYPFYIKVTGTDPGDYEVVRAKVSSRNILELTSESKVGSLINYDTPVIRGVAPPQSFFDAANKAYVDGFVTNVVGSTVEITPAANSIYKCGQLDQLTVTSPPSTGAYSIVFSSGATPTTTIIPLTILGLEDFAAEADTIYEINVLDNRAVIGSWR